ncbi:MAG: hypothetical protein HY361_00050 [Candidatus Aenigmarchaeota archaeon]|nr:hypothetical protein [Candidatus Aenigmarchaeota archaeon]
MISYEDIVTTIWNLPDTKTIDLESEISEIIRATGVSEELEVSSILEKNLPLVRTALLQKINNEIENDKIPKFIFSESSEYRLIGSVHHGKAQLFGKLSDELGILISDCNNLSESKETGVIFRVTHTSLASFSQIRIPVKTQEHFQKFIVALYKIFYEGASEERHLRIPKKFYTIIENGESKSIDDFIIFHIKHLRTFPVHDLDLVDDPEKTKRLVAQSCLKYAGKSSVIGLNSSEFLALQEKLLIDIKAFLEALKQDLLNS